MHNYEDVVFVDTSRKAVSFPQTTHPTYFAVSLTKLLVMSLFTFGLYQIYWFYKNWQTIKQLEHSNILPAARALFIVFFCYNLFERIKNAAIASGIKDTPPVGRLAAGWIILSLLYKLPDPYWFVTYFNALMLLPIQQMVNQMNAIKHPELDKNEGFTTSNIVTIVLGTLCMLLVIVGFVVKAKQHISI